MSAAADSKVGASDVLLSERSSQDMLPQFCLIVHFTSTWAMVGLIWIVQLVHYPMFASLEAEHFSEHMDAHQRQISWIVLPLMMAELLSGLAMLTVRSQAIPISWIVAGLFLLCIAWGSTFLIQVPQHTRLLQGYDAEVCQQLVASNWVRTAAWSLRGILAATMLWLVLK